MNTLCAKQQVVSVSSPDALGQAEAITKKEDELLTKKALAPRLHVTTRTIENWQKRGVIPYLKIGKVVLFVWADVLAALKTNFGVCRRTVNKSERGQGRA